MCNVHDINFLDNRDLTSKVFDYPTVGAYYRDASSVDNLLKVRVPMFILHARDDPVGLSDHLRQMDII